jgi:hypothetical protein
MKLKIYGMSEVQILNLCKTMDSSWIDGSQSMNSDPFSATPGMNRYVHTKVIQIRGKYSWSVVEHTRLPLYFFLTAFTGFLAFVLAFLTSSNIKYTFLLYKFTEID